MRLIALGLTLVLSGCVFSDLIDDVRTSEMKTETILSTKTPTEFAACAVAVGDLSLSTVPGLYRPTSEGAEIIWMGGVANASKMAAIFITENDGGSAVVGKVPANMPWAKRQLRDVDATIRQCV